ncbi:hypothetical protein [Thalassococcus sp. S3]|uniref:hypothetical protein n=1 Tax=Thalassococcus sp. S3 TaxID=2017482 RepID=UPI00102BCBC0|nr:hypothetical protein [Thalassococcus sp. S3]
MSGLPQRIRRWSQVFAYVTLAAMILIAGVFLLFLFRPALAYDVLVDAAPSVQVAGEIGVTTIYALLAVGALSVAVQLFLLWGMYRLFSLYAAGEALTGECGDCVSRIGAALLALPVASVIYGMASSVLLSWQNPEGQRELTIALSLHSIGFLIGGALLLMVGITIRQAAQVAEENRGFI